MPVSCLFDAFEPAEESRNVEDVVIHHDRVGRVEVRQSCSSDRCTGLSDCWCMQVVASEITGRYLFFLLLLGEAFDVTRNCKFTDLEPELWWKIEETEGFSLDDLSVNGLTPGT